jgi:hypothetical protein
VRERAIRKLASTFLSFTEGPVKRALEGEIDPLLPLKMLRGPLATAIAPALNAHDTRNLLELRAFYQQHRVVTVSFKPTDELLPDKITVDQRLPRTLGVKLVSAPAWMEMTTTHWIVTNGCRAPHPSRVKVDIVDARKMLDSYRVCAGNVDQTVNLSVLDYNRKMSHNTHQRDISEGSLFEDYFRVRYLHTNTRIDLPALNRDSSAIAH